jgi:hypothetical protein
MTQESVVYGCIKDMVFTTDMEETRRRRQVNRRVLLALPSVEDWPLLSREMFVMPSETLVVDDLHTDVVPFGSSYRGIEYEWEQWLSRFEAILRRMYWVAATVHLETEFNGTHTFVWQTELDCHEPDSGAMSMRCEWTRETVSF